jgi:hypothetical protein
MIYGQFSNPGGCTAGDQVFVKADHPQYRQIYAAALAAFLVKEAVSAYVHGCETIWWYSAAPNTFNVMDSASALAVGE